MSSLSARQFDVWQSSSAALISPIHGVFAFEIAPTLMVHQALQFLAETSLRGGVASSPVVAGFLAGMRYCGLFGDNILAMWRDFSDATELFSTQPSDLVSAVQEVELHTDVNLSFSKVRYLADLGSGPAHPLLVINRIPYLRGMAFEVEESGVVAHSLAVGDFNLSGKGVLAQRHYSTGMALLAGEDQLSGLIDASFMQFYLAIECLLEQHELKRALESGRSLYGASFDETIEAVVRHVYLARHRFFGHGHPRFLDGLSRPETAFAIAKQSLVARWCARKLLGFHVGRDLVKREMILFPGIGSSVAFRGDVSQLSSDFALPES